MNSVFICANLCSIKQNLFRFAYPQESENDGLGE